MRFALLRRRSAALLLNLCLLNLSMTGGGQALAAQITHGTLRVTVLDPSGSVVVGAHVVVSGAGDPTAARHEGVTNGRGEIVVPDLEPRAYRVLVEARGFEATVLSTVRVSPGETHRRVTLAIARVIEAVEVARNPREARSDPRGDAFTIVLGPDQIAALPDDPEAFEDAVQQLAGPGAVIRVDGFRGGRLPPKDRIQQIRFQRNLFTAAQHEAGVASADIRTRPGLGTWQGSLDAGGHGGPLAARNAYATSAVDQRSLRVAFTLDGPIRSGRTSVSLAIDGRWTSDVRAVRAALPSGLFTATVPRPSTATGFTARLHHALSSGHAVWIEGQGNRNRSDGLGAGGYDLPERAFTRSEVVRVVRFSERGPLGGRAYGEFRAEVGRRTWTEASHTEAPTIDVPQAFTAGGAQRAGGRDTREVEVSADVDVPLGRRHALRAGLLLEGGRYRADTRRNEAGTWTFSSLAALAAGTPTTYTRRLGDAGVAFAVARFGFYLQDDVRAGSGVTVSVGVRHEGQAYVTDRFALSPRAGVTWSPVSDGRTIIRAGAGVFRAWLEPEVLSQVLQVDGRRQRDLIVQRPGYPDPWGGGTALVLPPSRYELAPNLRLPRLLQASAGIEHRIAPPATVFATYVRSVGRRQFRGRDANAPDATGQRPAPLAGRIVRVESGARASGHVLSAGVNYNAPARRLFLTAMYSLAFRRNDADGPFDLPANPGDPSAEWGPSASDVRHQVTALVAAALGKGLRAGLQIRANSGSPYNVTTGFDDNRDGALTDRPRGVGRNAGRGEGLFDLGVRLGWTLSLGRRDGSALGLDATAPPSPPRWRLEIHLSATNATNAVNRTAYSGVMASPFFGQASATLPARRVDVGARVAF